jgi:hypothetical protein
LGLVDEDRIAFDGAKCSHWRVHTTGENRLGSLQQLLATGVRHAAKPAYISLEVQAAEPTGSATATIFRVTSVVQAQRAVRTSRRRFVAVGDNDYVNVGWLGLHADGRKGWAEG